MYSGFGKSDLDRSGHIYYFFPSESKAPTTDLLQFELDSKTSSSNDPKHQQGARYPRNTLRRC